MASGRTERKEEKVSGRSLVNAEKCLQKGNYGRAFAHYLLVLKLTPNKKTEIKDNFTLALREWSEQLEKSDRVKDLFKCYEQACELFPECETMLNNMGAQLFRLGYVDEAACFFRRSLKLDPDYLGARENLENICGHLVERWHFRMLNDRVRNEAYRGAIYTAIRDGFDQVLDIGTGTGLLSMIAVDSSARSVYGCDISKTMYEMSCDVILTNQKSKQIQLIHSKSTDLQIPQDIPERVSLVVTEIFDVALLGEGVLPSLHHAWKSLLKQPGSARVIPGGATMYVCGVESSYIREHNRFLYPGMQYLDFQGIDIECRAGSNDVNPSYEPYTSERLDMLPGGCKVLTQPIPFVHFNFNDPECIEKFLIGFDQSLLLPVAVNGRLDAIATWFDLHLDSEVTLSSAPGTGSCWEQAVFPILPSQLSREEQHNLLVRERDTVELNCTFASEYIRFRCTSIVKSTIRTKATDASTVMCEYILTPSWSQPHRPAPTTQTPAPPAHLSFGDLDMLGDLDNRTFDPYNLSSAVSSSTISDQSSMDDTSSSDELNFPESNISSLIESHLRVRNRMESQLSFRNNFVSHLRPAHHSEPNLRGASQSYQSRVSNPISQSNGCTSLRPLPSSGLLYTPHPIRHKPTKKQQTQSNGNIGENFTDRFLLDRNEVWKLNDLNYNRSLCTAVKYARSLIGSDFKLLTLCDGVPVIALQALQLGTTESCLINSQDHEAILHSIAANNNLVASRLQFISSEDIETLDGDYDVLLVELIDEGGCLHQRVLEDVALARATCLGRDPLIMPGRVTVQAMLIDSSALRRDSMVTSDENTLGFLVAGFMNDFQMTTHCGIDFTVLDHESLSHPFELLTFDLSEFNVGEVPSYLDLSNSITVTATETGTVHAILYWFDLHLTPEIKVSSLDSKFHWKQAAILQKFPITVSRGSTLRVKSVCRNNCIHASVSELWI